MGNSRRSAWWIGLVSVLLLSACADDARTTTTGTTEPGEAMYSAPDPSVCPVDRASPDGDAPPRVDGVQGASSGGSGETRVSWGPSPDPDVVCYRVERAQSLTNVFVLAAVVRVEGTTVVPHPDANRYDPYAEFDGRRFSVVEYAGAVPGGDAGCCVYYRVSAVDLAGNESEPSSVTCASDAVSEMNGSGCESVDAATADRLDGRTFMARSATLEGRPLSAERAGRIEITFETGAITASVGCNRMSTAATITASRLVVAGSSWQSTKMGCDWPEEALKRFLESEPTISGGFGHTLRLTGANGTLDLIDTEGSVCAGSTGCGRP